MMTMMMPRACFLTVLWAAALVWGQDCDRASKVWQPAQQACVCKPGFVATAGGACKFEGSVVAQTTVAANGDSSATVKIQGADVEFLTLNAATRLSDMLQNVGNLSVAAAHQENALASLSNNTAAVVVGLDARLATLETELFGSLPSDSLFAGGDFAGGLNMKNFVAEASTGNFDIVALSPNALSPSGATFALRFRPVVPLAPQNYFLRLLPTMDQPLCAGTYRIHAWAKVSQDWVGRPTLLSARLFDALGAGKNASVAPEGVASGAWPGVANTWEPVEVSITTTSSASKFEIYLAYPANMVAGTVWVTSVSVQRLGPAGACTDGRVDSLLADLAATKSALAALTANVSTTQGAVSNLQKTTAGLAATLSTTQAQLLDVNKSLVATQSGLAQAQMSLVGVTANVAALQAANATTQTTLNQLIANFTQFVNSSSTNLLGLDNRVSFLLDEYYVDQINANLIGNANFANGQGVTGWIASESYGSWTIVDVSADPPASKSQYALRFNPDPSGTGAEYEIHRRPDAPPLCAGTYRFTANAKYSADWDGYPMLLHARFFLSNGGTAVQSPTGAVSGGFPTRPNEWQRIQASIVVPSLANAVSWYVGYPMNLKAGNVWITDLNMERLGAAGACNAFRRSDHGSSPVLELDSMVTAMQGQLESQQARLEALESKLAKAAEH